MFKLLYCIQNEHDLRLVALAGLICVGAALAVVTLLRRARDSGSSERLRWLAAAGSASGFGIWATHFIAMIGYDPGVVVGYGVVPTALSLLIAIAATTAGFALAIGSTGKGRRALAAMIVGLGVAAMHYLGMEAVEMPVHMAWSATYVIISIVFAILPMIPALTLTVKRRSKGTPDRRRRGTPFSDNMMLVC